MNQKFCQSCSMPLPENKELNGANKDGSLNEDYCKYCYENGKFTWDCTMDEMIDFSAKQMKKFNPKTDEKAAINNMKQFFPHLKRWENS